MIIKIVFIIGGSCGLGKDMVLNLVVVGYDIVFIYYLNKIEVDVVVEVI